MGNSSSFDQVDNWYVGLKLQYNGKPYEVVDIIHGDHIYLNQMLGPMAIAFLCKHNNIQAHRDANDNLQLHIDRNSSQCTDQGFQLQSCFDDQNKYTVIMKLNDFTGGVDSHKPVRRTTKRFGKQISIDGRPPTIHQSQQKK